MSDLHDRYASFLAATGRKLTNHRSRTVDAVIGMQGPFTREELFARIDGVVSRATAFRTLSHLIEAKLLVEVNLSGMMVLVLIA